MELEDLKKELIREEYKIKDSYGRILCFIDFGNVNYWFESDRQTYDRVALTDGQKIQVDVSKLRDFLHAFSSDLRFYYGFDPSNEKSFGFMRRLKEIYGSSKLFTKKVQKIRHYLEGGEMTENTRQLHTDYHGDFIHIPKCNFDVEISVDAIKVLEHYDTVCLLSGDADFVHLLRFLKKKGKKVILIKGGHITTELREMADLVINAQDIKKHVSEIKQKPGIKPGFADRKTQIHGQDDLKKS